MFPGNHLTAEAKSNEEDIMSFTKTTVAAIVTTLAVGFVSTPAHAIANHTYIDYDAIDWTSVPWDETDWETVLETGDDPASVRLSEIIADAVVVYVNPATAELEELLRMEAEEKAKAAAKKFREVERECRYQDAFCTGGFLNDPTAFPQPGCDAWGGFCGGSPTPGFYDPDIYVSRNYPTAAQRDLEDYVYEKTMRDLQNPFDPLMTNCQSIDYYSGRAGIDIHRSWSSCNGY